MLNFLAEQAGFDWMSWIVFPAMIVIIIVMFIVSNKRNKKKQEEAQALIDAVKPGNKVKTIGGVCGIVVEVDLEENTFVLETGSEDTGKSYIKFMKEAIYQTDAVVEKKDETPTEAPAEQPAPETDEKAE